MNSSAPAGFKNSTVGLIPKDWDVRLLGETLQFISGKAHEPFVSSTGDFVLVNSKFVSTNGAVRKHVTANLTPARKGDVLMVMSDLPNGRALAKCFLVDADRKYAVNQRVCILRSSAQDARYLMYILNRNPYFMAFDDGVQQTHLLNGPIKKCPLVLPKKREQEAISDALGGADALIASLQRLIAKKQAIKQGMMQQLLTGKTRLPGFTGAWTSASLSEIGLAVRGVGYDPKTDLHAQSSTNTLDLLRSNNVQGGELVLSDVQHVDRSRVREDQILCAGDIVICVANGSKKLVGKSALWVGQGLKTHTFGAFMAIFRTDQTRADPYLVNLLMQTKPYRDWIDILLAGSSINNLRPSDIAGFVTELPSGAEQLAIVKVFKDVDGELKALSARLNTTQRIKQGMMQELLTGRTRLTPAGETA